MTDPFEDAAKTNLDYYGSLAAWLDALEDRGHGRDVKVWLQANYPQMIRPRVAINMGRDPADGPVHKRSRQQIAIAWRRIKDDNQRACTYCGGEGTEGRGPDDEPWHLDHVVPLCRGGPDEAANLVLACATCNGSKGRKTLDEWQAA